MRSKKIKPPRPKILFRVKHILTGKYLTGTGYTRWTATGRIWTRVADIRNHLLHIRDWRARYGGNQIDYDYENWRVIPYDLVAMENNGTVEHVPVEDFIKASAKPNK